MKDDERNRMRLNLQFFAEDGENADGVGVNETEAADQSTDVSNVDTETAVETSVGTESETEEAAAPQTQSRETNAAFANMRRQLEAAEARQRQIDEMYARQFGNYTNPETGQPIRSAADYVEAMAAQERAQTRAQLQEANIDPNLIDNMIANSPAIRAAKEATAELNNIKANQMMEEDFRTILGFDPTKSSFDDIVNDPSYGAVVDYVSRVPGMRFSEAYKLVNFDRLSKSQTAAAKQAVVNQVKGQSHLSTGGGVTTGSSEEDIPANMLEMYKDTFPEKSMAELKALYNKTIQNRR